MVIGISSYYGNNFSIAAVYVIFGALMKSCSSYMGYSIFSILCLGIISVISKGPLIASMQSSIFAWLVSDSFIKIHMGAGSSSN